MRDRIRRGGWNIGNGATDLVEKKWYGDRQERGYTSSTPANVKLMGKNDSPTNPILSLMVKNKNLESNQVTPDIEKARKKE